MDSHGSSDLPKLIKDFCECVLDDKQDSSIFTELPVETKRFFDKNKDSLIGFKEKQLSSHIIDVTIRQTCANYCCRMLLDNKVPYVFYSKQYMEDYFDAIKEHFSVNHHVSISNDLNTLLHLISLKALEFQNSKLYVNNQLTEELKKRSSNIDKQYRNLMTEISEIEEDVYSNIDYVSSVVQAAEEVAQDVKEREKKTNETSITILSIFSAVVLVFNGSFAFTTTTLQNINAASIYRLLMVILFVGFVLLNVAYGLFYFIARLTKYKDNTDNPKVRPLWVSNICFFVLMCIVFLCWSCNIVENRGNCMYSQQDKDVSVSVEASEINDETHIYK